MQKFKEAVFELDSSGFDDINFLFLSGNNLSVLYHFFSKP